MKRILSVAALLTACVLLFAACGNNNDTEAKDKAWETTEYSQIDAQTLPYYAHLQPLLEKNDDPQLEYPRTDAQLVARHAKQENWVMHRGEKGAVPLDQCVGFSFVSVCKSVRANPFANFNTLLGTGLLKRETNEQAEMTEQGITFDFTHLDAKIALELNAATAATQKQSYPYTQEGCAAFMREVVLLAGTNTTNDYFLMVPQGYPPMYYSEADNCYYSYVLRYDTSYAYIAAIYLRSDDRKTVTDVTSQTLFNAYPITDCAAGVSIGMEINRCNARFEVVSLLTSIEKVLTGTCYVQEYTNLPVDQYLQSYTVPTTYTLDGYTANVARNRYRVETGPLVETFDTHTYSIGK